ncbi:UDP-N-acetylglucosamine 2-epimerase (hydrolyzing), partial [Candidatus Woesearchaeota archaeon]|nr:UDP-N-acetylglucosamine 2-epimerase (hydrolyzing) [Candidatus Woesearchaeota archaeon]
GLMRSTLNAIRKHPLLKIELIVTGTHFSKKFGYTVNEIIKDGFKIHKVKILDVKDELSMLKSFSEGVVRISKVLKKINPDILLIEGDRYEALSATIGGAFLGIPIAHVSGGDVSGSIDDSIRHSITKFADIHFPGTDKSAERVIKMGEDPKNVFMVGTPGIERSRLGKKQIIKKFGDPAILVVQHSVTTEIPEAGFQMRETMRAVSELGMDTIVVYPNSDPGSKHVIKEIEKYKNNKNIKVYKNIPRDYFLGLMDNVSVMVGNSSAGITEAPLFNLPVVNIGSRQKGRERAHNIYDVGHDHKKIIAIIRKILDRKEKKSSSPYSGEGTPEKIAEILSKVKLK